MAPHGFCPCSHRIPPAAAPARAMGRCTPAGTYRQRLPRSPCAVRPVRQIIRTRQPVRRDRAIGTRQGTNRTRHPHAAMLRTPVPSGGARFRRQVRPRRSLRVRSTASPATANAAAMPVDACGRLRRRSCAPVPSFTATPTSGTSATRRRVHHCRRCRRHAAARPVVAESIRTMRRQPEPKLAAADPAVTRPIPHPAPAPPDAGPPATPNQPAAPLPCPETVPGYP